MECLKAASLSSRNKNDWIRTQINCSSGQILRTAVDGKHIRMRKANENESPFFNYKNFSQLSSWLWQMQNIV